MNERKCPFCGKGTLRRKVKNLRFTYKRKSTVIEQPGEYCTACKEGIVNGADIKATEKEYHDFQARVDGYLTSGEIRRIRQRLGLTQQQAGRLFGGGPNAFSRYERGEVQQSRALDQLLRLLDGNPELLDQLESEAA